MANLTESLLATLKTSAAKNGPAPYAGKEKPKNKKLPVPPPKPAQQAASASDKPFVVDPAKDPGPMPKALLVENRKPLTKEQQKRVDAAAAKAKAESSETRQAALKAAQKKNKSEKAKIKATARKERKQAAAAGKTTAMPLSGKAAAKAIAETARAASGKAKERVNGSAKGRTAPKAEKRTSEPRKPRRNTPSGKITLLVKENPKRTKAAKRFALYKTGMTTADYVKAVVAKLGASETLANADIRWDIAHKFIAVK